MHTGTCTVLGTSASSMCLFELAAKLFDQALEVMQPLHDLVHARIGVLLHLRGLCLCLCLRLRLRLGDAFQPARPSRGSI